MPGRHIEHGKYGARGTKGSEAIAWKADDVADGIATPIE